MLLQVLCTCLSMDIDGDFTAVNFSSAHRSHVSKDSPHRQRLCLITSVPGLRDSTAVKTRCPGYKEPR